MMSDEEIDINRVFSIGDVQYFVMNGIKDMLFWIKRNIGIFLVSLLPCAANKTIQQYVTNQRKAP